MNLLKHITKENDPIRQIYYTIKKTDWYPKFGKKFKNASKLFDHAAHNGSNYLNGHCFVSLMLCVPVWNDHKVIYRTVPLGYCMWQKKKSKPELAATMIRQAMPEFCTKKNVVILCDSRYAGKDLVCVVNDYSNPDIICNAGCDSVLYDLAPKPAGRKGRPAKHGRRVLTNIFGAREIPAYVTSAEKDSGSRRLFFSTVFPEQLHVFCA